MGLGKFTDPPKKKNPPILIPTVWTTPPRGHELDEDWEKKQEEQELVAFMQECRERTADMKDEEKCERCKLRFRCYTEIKIEKKRKTKTGGVTRIGRKQPIIFRAQTFTSQQAAEFPAPEFDWAKVIHDIGKSSESDSQTKSPSNNH